MIPIRQPLRDRQGDRPCFFCARCGQEQYDYDPPAWEGLCAPCRRRQERREEDAMTLQEMSAEYRANARTILNRIHQLQAARRLTESPAEREILTRRLEALGKLWREARDLASHMEHYYERGFRRDARYTL